MSLNERMPWAKNTMAEWNAASKATRKALYAKALVKTLAEASKSLKGDKQLTSKQRKTAENIARGIVGSKMWKTESIDGIENPTWNDPEWGYGTQLKAKRITKAEDAKADSELDDLLAWLETQEWSDFAKSLAAQGRKTGSLSAKQLASATKMRATMKAKEDAKAKAPVVPVKTTGLDLSDLPSGYYSVPGGTRLKVRISRPTTRSKWHGWIFVADGAEYGVSKNYGKQAPSGLYQGDIKDELATILEDPFEAQKAYGRLWGVCGKCGRKLEDEASIAKGIGPVCEAGW